MDEVGLLVRAIIREKPYDLLLESRGELNFANKVLEGDHSTKALEAVLDCIDKTGECPPNIATVVRFIQNNEHFTKEYEKTAGYEEQLNAIAELNTIESEEDNLELGAATLIDNIYTRAYNKGYAFIHLEASKIAVGAHTNPHTKESGPEAAKEYIHKEEANLYVRGAKYVHGDLKENLDYVEEQINSYIKAGDTKRLYTGFKHIDNITLIGRKQPIRWIGILGYTNHGKSLLLNTMLYNIACEVSNVMLCPLEQTIDYTYMSFVWLHYRKVCPDRKLIPLSEWQKLGSLVGHDVWKTVQMIIEDLRHGTTLKGKLVIESAKSWKDVEDKLRLTNKRNKYDVLAVDYIGHLNVVGGNKGESETDKHNRDFSAAMELARDGVDNDKTGLVVITPPQAGKKHWEAVREKEGDNYGVYDSPAAVDFYTKAAHDLDCLIGLWHEGDTCLASDPRQMIVYCLKARFNMKFPKFRLALSPESGLLYDLDDVDKRLDPERTAADMSAAAIDKSLCVTTTTH